MSITYKNLYSQVVSEIEKRLSYNTKSSYQNQTSRTFTTSSGVSSNPSIVELVNAIQDLLANALPSVIISGLEVSATNPISHSINISSGSGAVGGVLYELSQNLTLAIPFDATTSVFYVVLYQDRIMIEKTYSSKKLTVAKVVVSKPGQTVYVQDQKDTSWNAYIVNFKEYKLYGYNNKFEEDTVELLRDNISPILADNLIGNIRLSEDLKIINTQGTVELDSTSLKLLSTLGTTLAKFNRNGTFFYDDNGIEIAKFTTNEARVGNIRVLKNSIQSGNFVSGTLGSGFQILDSGDAEFNNILARGKLTSSVFEKDTVSSIGGNLLVSDSDILDLDMTSLDSSTLTISGDTTFAVGNILRIKDGINDEWLEVINSSLVPIYTVTRDKANVYSSNNNPIWKKGTAVINYGSSGAGLIYMTASESNAPYFSVVTHSGSPWSSLITQVKIGNLNGFLDYLTNEYGIGIGDTNSYLKYDPLNGLRIKGSVIITGGTTTITSFKQSATLSGEGIPTSLSIGDLWINTDNGRLYRALIVGANEITSGEWEEQQTVLGNNPDISEGLYLGSDYMGYFSGIEWQSYIKSNGEFYLKGDSTNHLCWDKSTLEIRGSLTADDIKAGTLTLTNNLCIQNATSTNKTVFDAYGLRSYDGNGDLKLKICDGHIEAQDIKLQDPLCISCYSFLDAGRLKFHDTLGDVPYVTRICSGTVATGGKVTLVGWNYSPEVTVGVKELLSYNSTQAAACQKWLIYNDTPICFYTSPTDYGYCFIVHASLVTAVSTGGECIKNAAMDACILTGTCVCTTNVRIQLQLWCNNAAPSNYYYGTICYALCYRVNGSGTWCACCYCYTQPHASTAQLTTTTNQCQTLVFPCGECWQIMAHQVSISYTDTGICATSTTYCCYSCTVCATNCCLAQNGYYCQGTCNFSICFSGLPSGIYCSQLSWSFFCVGANDSYMHQYLNGGTVGDYASFPEARITTCGYMCCVPAQQLCWNCGNYVPFIGAYSYNGSVGLSCVNIQTCANKINGAYTTTSTVQASICAICQILCYCVACNQGNCALCNHQCFYSITDTYASQCVLDPGGCINWLAISYN